MANPPEQDVTIAFLGTGQMGAPMASRLISAGFRVRVWNRSKERVRALVGLGAVEGSTPAAAAAGADVVITMLPDGPTVEEVVTGPDGVLPALGPGALWLQMGTIGLDWTERMRSAASEAAVVFVDAPVSGSVGPATNGQLIILASGPVEAQPIAGPIFDALGRHTYWLGAAGAGARTKLVLNNWLVDLVEMVAETLKVSRAFDIDPHVVIDILSDAPIGSPYGVAKARSMLEGDFTSNFALKHALKDARLTVTAAHEIDVELALTESLIATWQRAMDDGAGDLDLSVVFRYV